MIVVIDYGRGNLFSLGAALDRIGRPYRVSDNPNDVRAARQLILPGVGAFGDATTALEQRGLKQAILAAVDGGASLLGICVGCQLLMTSGTEFGMFPGLGIIPGTVERLPEGNGSADGFASRMSAGVNSPWSAQDRQSPRRPTPAWSISSTPMHR